ncbi:DNA replication licensing factor mcm4 [Smittium mucronatum]|uniref:DNA helicase n=1 Tax=Smittium mucronatum TaxID=133383 RepID=A0A1R0H5H4_9FUNG|nr:DNA replication licensing factor mcm4 [Smittium mucronatum]
MANNLENTDGAHSGSGGEPRNQPGNTDTQPQGDVGTNLQSQPADNNVRSSSPNLRFSDLPSTPMVGLNFSNSNFPTSTGGNIPIFNRNSSELNQTSSQIEVSTPGALRGRRRGDIGPRGLKSLNSISELSSLNSSQAAGASNQSQINSDFTRGIQSEVVFSNDVTSQIKSASGELSQETPQEIRVIWGTMVNVRDVMQTFKDFLLNFTLNHYKEFEKKSIESTSSQKPGYQDLVEFVEDIDNDSDQLVHKPLYTTYLERIHQTEVWQLNLNALHLLSYKKTLKLYKQLVNYPEEVIPIMDHVLTETYMNQYPDEQYDIGVFGLKVRPFNLAESKNMRSLDPGDIDKLISIKGMLIRASSIIPDMEQGFFKCLQCDWTVIVPLDRGIILQPTRCGNPDCSANDTMELIHNRSIFADKQTCRLQETPDMIPDGQTPHTVSMVLHDEFVDSIKPGDRLEVTGIFRGAPVRKNPTHRTVQALYRTYIDVVHLKKTSSIKVQPDLLDDLNDNDSSLLSDLQAIGIGGSDDSFDSAEQDSEFLANEESEFRKLSTDPRLMDILTKSLAPSIYEMDAVKKGLLLQLFGGERKHLKRTGAPRSRGDIHILLIGDPGVSKSQLLSAVHTLAPRGIYTSGKGSSAVGLTAYITRDPDSRELVLESGALVLSDGGICCIDEFDKMSDSTKSILHEAMEQQTVSITKAGIIASLNARAAILAAANPVDSKWNQDLSIVENINLPHSLISRFDLIFIVLDNVDEMQDRRLAKHIVSLYIDPTLATNDGEDGESDIPSISTNKLTRYINYARQNIRPVISDEAAQVLVTSYVELRKLGRDSSYSNGYGSSSNKRVTATTRQLESMIRMSEALAKMRLSNVVEENDVTTAFNLMREALRESATDPRTGLIDLDLLNTGFAASDRRQLDAIKIEVRKMLAGSSSSGNKSGQDMDSRANGDFAGNENGADISEGSNILSYQAWFDKLNNQSSVPVGSRLFEQVVRELETEGVVQVSGHGRNAFIIPKQASFSSTF